MHDDKSPKQLAARLTSLRPGELQILDAFTNGLVQVTEKPRASVPTLLVINDAALPILILDGEEVVGGLQNRVVNTTLLVPAASTLELDVSCVEHGRWGTSTTESFSPGEAVYPSLRRQKAEHVTASLAASGVPRADQAAVWNEIAARHARHATRSSTLAVHDAYVERAEALRRAEDSLRYPAVASRRDGHRRWTARMRRHLRSGDDVRLAGRELVGAALVHEGSAVHTAIFRTDRRAESAVSRPSVRARRLRLARQ